MRALPALLLTGCFGLRATDLQLSECADGAYDTGASGSGSLTATVSGEHEVDVQHNGVFLNCCTERARVLTEVEGTNIDLDYEEKGDVCDCICSFDLSYTLKGVPTGNWRLAYGEAEAFVTLQ